MRREILTRTRKLLLGVLTLPLLAACEDSDRATVAVQLTDALADYIETAEVWVSRVYLQGGPGNATDTEDANATGRVYLFDDPENPFQVDLLTLSNGVVENLAESGDVQPGSYNQLRIVVDSAVITLKSPYKFEDGTTTKVVKIPSGSTSGVKVQLGDDLPAEAGETTSILVDFDVESSFSLPAASAPNTFRNPTMAPVIKEKSRS